MNIVLRKTEVMQSAADVYSNDVAERVSDVLGNMPAIQSFARADEETSALNRMIDRMLNAQLPVLTWWAFASVATRSSSTMALVSILVTGVWLLMQDLTTVGQIVAFMSLSQMLVGRLEQTVGLRQLHAEPVAADPDVLRGDGHASPTSATRPTRSRSAGSSATCGSRTCRSPTTRRARRSPT